MTHTTTDAAEARAFPREQIARLCMSHMYGFDFTGESLCDEADRIFSEPHPRAIRAVGLADAIAKVLATAEAASGAGLQANTMDIVEGICGTLKPRVIGYDPLNSFVVTNMARWLVPALSDGAHTWEDADETMQERADAAAKAVIAEIQEDMCNTAPIEAASGAGEREEWSFTPDTREAKVVAQLSEEQELSPQAVMRQALRLYQSDFLRRKAGETVTWSGDAQRARDFAGPLASLPPATDPAIPDGWKLVPIEPTQQQHNAGNMAQDDVDQTDARAIYRAMLAAAPSIPATGEAVPEGMKPWHGGDGPPEDWNGGRVYYANGQTAHPLDHADWQRPADIPLVAYTPKATIAATGHAAAEGEGA